MQTITSTYNANNQAGEAGLGVAPFPEWNSPVELLMGIYSPNELNALEIKVGQTKDIHSSVKTTFKELESVLEKLAKDNIDYVTLSVQYNPMIPNGNKVASILIRSNSDPVNRKGIIEVKGNDSTQLKEVYSKIERAVTMQYKRA